MPDSFREVTQQGWLSRLGQSIKSVLVGLILFVLSFPLLYWNESRAVRTARGLKEGAGAVVSVQAGRVDSGNQGKLVHMSGEATTPVTLMDEEFGVSARALKLIRKVEMYQWVEEEKSEEQKKLGGGTEKVTTYEYKKQWSSDPVDSSSFRHPEGHGNPGGFPVEGQTLVAEPITLGAFTLSEPIVEKLSDAEGLPVTQEAAARISADRPVQVSQGGFYLGANPSTPQVGDVRVSFQVVKIGPRSLVARQVGSTFEAYPTAAGHPILLVEDGVHSADAMFKTAEAQNRMLTWLLRAAGFFLMFIGLVTIFKPISVLGDVVPLVGSLLGAGLGIFGFLTALCLSLLTIAVSWIVVRPFLGITLLVLAGGAAFWLFSVARKKKAARAAVPPPPVPV